MNVSEILSEVETAAGIGFRLTTETGYVSGSRNLESARRWRDGSPFSAHIETKWPSCCGFATEATLREFLTSGAPVETALIKIITDGAHTSQSTQSAELLHPRDSLPGWMSTSHFSTGGSRSRSAEWDLPSLE